ncbi:hypothetical protein [Sphingomonas sp.]|uniref:hypothetical protein n=1 Tax=Sphingomonas sp. TaxID=28214 RepID=UPI0025810317|nr:hypothetical protein [Sphingomonas sp.]
MAFLGALATPLIGAIGGLALSKLNGSPKPPTPLRPVTRDDAAAQIAADDEIRRRQGAAADIITGTGGAEAPMTGGKLTLGS